jgi:hypothetical protein
MSIPRDPSLRFLDTCGCCSGGAAATVTVQNRPGRAAIAYRRATW